MSNKDKYVQDITYVYLSVVLYFQYLCVCWFVVHCFFCLNRLTQIDLSNEWTVK
mgnify:CR=1 FL=1